MRSRLFLLSCMALIFAPGTESEANGSVTVSSDPPPVKGPTTGRIVHYFPSAEEIANRTGAGSNGATVVPAVVVRTWDNQMVNLKVLCDGEQDVWRTSVQHASNATAPPYWSWPPIN